MRIKNWLSVFIAVVVAVLMFTTTVSAVGGQAYILDADGSTHLPTPQTYKVDKFIRNLGEEGGSLREPTELFIAPDDSIFIADTGNDRIVKLSPDGEYICSYTVGDTLDGPQGVYVEEDGDIYISDTLNERIVHLDPQGNFIEEFVRPESTMLDEEMDFQVGRIALSVKGYLYTIRGQYFMEIDAENQFRGFVGTNMVPFSLRNLLIRMFASEAQKAKLLKDEPPSYNSFAIDDTGLVYATMANSMETSQIQVINMVEKNTYPKLAYGEKTKNYDTGNINNPQFVDIAVGDGKLIYVLEQYARRIFVYDRDGQLITAFGGEGTVKGRFSVPVALDVNSRGDLLVLDKQTGCVHWFETTKFMNNIIQAINLYEDGLYEEAAEQWEAVLESDANYLVANYSMGNCLYKFEEYEQAMKVYKQADNAEGYGKAFSAWRHSVFRDHFFLVVVIIAVLFAALLLACGWLKRLADKVLDRYFATGGLTARQTVSVAEHMLLTLIHPLDNLDIIKVERRKKSAWWALPGLLFAAIVINYTYIFYAHYSLNSKTPLDANILLEAALILVPYISWTVAAYAMSSIMSGESKIGEQALAYAYAFTPYLVLKPLIGLLSNVLCFNEIGLYNFLQVFALGWTLLLIFIALKRLNDYSFGKTVAVTLLAIFMIVIMWAVLLLLASLTIQTGSFFSGLFEEINMKYFR